MILTALPDPLALSFGYKTRYSLLNRHYSLIELVFFCILSQSDLQRWVRDREGFSPGLQPRGGGCFAISGPSVVQCQLSRGFAEAHLASRLPHLLHETAVLMETDRMQFSAYFMQVWKLTLKITFLCT